MPRKISPTKNFSPTVRAKPRGTRWNTGFVRSYFGIFRQPREDNLPIISPDAAVLWLGSVLDAVENTDEISNSPGPPGIS